MKASWPENMSGDTNCATKNILSIDGSPFALRSLTGSEKQNYMGERINYTRLLLYLKRSISTGGVI